MCVLKRGRQKLGPLLWLECLPPYGRGCYGIRWVRAVHRGTADASEHGILSPVAQYCSYRKNEAFVVYTRCNYSSIRRGVRTGYRHLRPTVHRSAFGIEKLRRVACIKKTARNWMWETKSAGNWCSSHGHKEMREMAQQKILVFT